MKTVNRLAQIGWGLLACAVALMVIYYLGRLRKPMRFPHIPQETSSWIQGLSDKGNSLDVSLRDRGPYKWENEKDYGARNPEWSSVDDENFVVYYHPDEDNLWVFRAGDVLSWANRAIPDLERLMGRYPYPEYINHRKLAIYLPNTGPDYVSTINAITGDYVNSAGSIGMCVTSLGPLGAKNEGIVLHPNCFDKNTDRKDGAYVTLRHEMTHFVYYANLDYSRVLEHPLWVVEGMAEFFCDRRPGKVSGMDSILFIKNRCSDLSSEFPDETNSSYWAGESFFNFTKEVCGPEAPSIFIGNLYSQNVIPALDTSFARDSSVSFHTLWVESLLPTVDTLENVRR
jgi:hypothetical protein